MVKSILNKCFRLLFPILYAYHINKKLRSDISQSDYSKIFDDWVLRLEQHSSKFDILEKISFNAYSDNNSRIYQIESKAISLIASIGFVIAMLAILLNFSEQKSPIVGFAVLIFIFSILNMITAAYGSIMALKIGERHVIQIESFSNVPDQMNFYQYWIAHYLTCTYLNNKIGLVKSNWTSSSQSHLMRGLTSLFFGSIIIVFKYWFPDVSIYDYIMNWGLSKYFPLCFLAY